METGSVLSVGGLLTFLAGLIKWLINAYFKSLKEIEEVRRNNNQEQIDSIKETNIQARTDMKAFEFSLNEFKIKLAQHSIKIENFESKALEIQNEFKRVANQLEDRYKALEGAELIQIRDNTFIFKAKK